MDSIQVFLIIFSAAIIAFTLRYLFLRNPSKDAIKSIDALTAIAMAIVVFGLMTGFGDAMLNRPSEILLFIVSYQIPMYLTPTLLGRIYSGQK